MQQDLKDPGYRKIQWDVPYLCQFDYPKQYTAWTGCGPTSSAMLLNYYYPSQHCDMLDFWQSGVMQYNYHGPAVKYFNFAFAATMEQERTDTLRQIMPEYMKYFGGNYAAGTWLSMRPYFEYVWAFVSAISIIRKQCLRPCGRHRYYAWFIPQTVRSITAARVPNTISS